MRVLARLAPPLPLLIADLLRVVVGLCWGAPMRRGRPCVAQPSLLPRRSQAPARCLQRQRGRP
eukprot:15363963-Alexandrium_andersonii.AAC.1